MGTDTLVAALTGVGRTELTLAQLRERQRRILAAVARHCEEHSITFYLCAGTLLGAVRHRGYIPWDDDIDIMLPRPDYERFCATFPSTDPDTRLSLHASQTSPTFPLPFAKVCDETTLIEVESDIVHGIGVYVDVFPLDGWCTRPTARALQRWAIFVLSRQMRVKHLTVGRSRGFAKTAMLIAAKRATRLLPARRVAAALTWVARRSRYEVSDDVGVIVWGYHEAIPRRCYGSPTTVRFEGMRLPAPADVDGVLSRLYGDYLTLPPESERVTNHRFRAFTLE